MKLYKTMLTAATIAAFGVAGCDSMFEITNPGPMTDDALTNPAAFAGLVAGMSGDLSEAIDNIGYASATMSGELSSTGFTSTWLAIGSGRMVPSDANDFWDTGQRARWVAEDGIRRMVETGHDSPLVARAHLLAGYANRLLGEHFCAAVFDGGPEEPFSAYFERARDHFVEAGAIAARFEDDDLVMASQAGRASVLAALGDWAGAAQVAAGVPIDFRYDAVFSLNSPRETSGNLIYYPLEHSEGTVYGTEWAEVTDDKRVPWEIARDPGGAPRMGRDSRTPWYRALKYTTRGDDVALSKGTEMALLRAEAALRSGDIPGMLSEINRARAYHEMPPIESVAADEAWTLLKYERGAELWLEGRRFWDRRRWHAEGLDAYIANHESKCFPVAQSELDSNSNLTG